MANSFSKLKIITTSELSRSSNCRLVSTFLMLWQKTSHVHLDIVIDTWLKGVSDYCLMPYE